MSPPAEFDGVERTEAVRIWLLGGFRVAVGSRTVQESAWRLRKAASLVKLLALAPGHRMHREQAMNLLWPESDKKAASNNLRQTLHAARRALTSDPAEGSRYMASEDESLALCPAGSLWVDVKAFEQAASTASRSHEPTAYEVALDLYGGELLPADRYEEWAKEYGQRLRETRLSLLLGLARIYEERADYNSAAEALRVVVSEQSTREEAHAGLMRLYALMGSKREALAQYERLEEALQEALGTEPSASSRALKEEITSGRFPPKDGRFPGSPLEEPPGDGKHNLPAPRTSFAGREGEILEVKRTLAMTRLLTLTGTGGLGKTRLALEVARDLVGVYPEGVWLVELAPLTEPELVVPTVARTLEVREQPERTLLDTLIEALGDKEILLVVDNCEHLANAAAHMADALLSGCPKLRILATSREALGVGGEVLCQIPLLSLPATTGGEPDAGSDADSLVRYEAVQLFVDRARLRLPDFGLTQENSGAVARVCRKLDGIPLAIELATARLGALTVEQVAQRLEVSLDVLKGASVAADPRHQTLRATLDWSYELLSQPERKLYGRLSVFTGGFSLEAAEAVGATDDIEQHEVLESLLSLVDKSLVVAEAANEGRMRYRMLEPVRQYGLERLEMSGEVQEVRRRHAGYFLALAEEAEPRLRGPEQAAWFERLDAENDNLRGALSWLLEQGEGVLALRLSGALGEFWHVRGHLEEGRRWLEATLARGDDAPARIKALLHAGWIAWEQLDYERSEALGEEALALAREQGDSAATARALYIQGAPTLYQLDFDRAAALFEEAARLQRGVGDVAGLARTIQALGLTATARHDFMRAVELHEECLALAREAGDQIGIIVALGMGAFAYLGQGDHRRAMNLFREGLELSRSLGTKHGIAFHLHAAAALASTQGQPVRSARLWGAGESLMQAIGTGLGPVERYHYGPYVDAARALVGEAAWEEAFAQGMAMSVEEAVEYALSEEVAPTAPESPPAGGATDDPLTRREQEVAALVARGFSNRHIAQELHLSERTIENHIANIMRKLGGGSRTKIASWATQQRFISPEPE
jgi:predicted ATPase/DNA-binding SARP family transcriptional activator/DNA-binding CsgD family transcriptional regulator